MLSTLEHKILAAIQNGLPMTLTPYTDLASRIGIPVEQLLATLKGWQHEGKLRRVGAIVNHFQLSRPIGALVAWDIPSNDIDRIGELFASFSQVSHVYQRPALPQWPYSLYTMVHGQTDDDLHSTVAAMSKASGITEFQELKTQKELKKTHPVYTVKS